MIQFDEHIFQRGWNQQLGYNLHPENQRMSRKKGGAFFLVGKDRLQNHYFSQGAFVSFWGSTHYIIYNKNWPNVGKYTSPMIGCFSPPN